MDKGRKEVAILVIDDDVVVVDIVILIK